MNISEAEKQVRATKPKENCMVIHFELGSYDRLLLPHKDGMALMAALANAERLIDGWSEKRITDLARDTVVAKVMSAQEVEDWKVATLLNVLPEDLKRSREQAKQPTP